MLNNYNLGDIIPLITIGALSITAIYHSILYYFNSEVLLGKHCLFLWIAFSFLVVATVDFQESTLVVTSLQYLLSSAVFWLSILSYLNLLLTILDVDQLKKPLLLKMVEKTYFFTPLYFIIRFPALIFPIQDEKKLLVFGYIIDAFIFLIFIYLLFLIITYKKRDFNKYIVIGSFLMIFFNIFTSYTYNNQEYILGLNSISFISLGYFSSIIFFSPVVGLEIRSSLKEKYAAMAEATKKGLELELEKKKLIEALLAYDHEVQTERTKAIITQRKLIGRKLHDELSGNLVALRYLTRDFKIKASNLNEKVKLQEIEDEINNIYNYTRNYSHELALNVDMDKDNLAYDIPSCLEKLENQFTKIGLINVNSNLHAQELVRLSIEQNNHLYFFIKECFSNTIKHSNAANIWVSILFLNEKCTVSFVDDGTGFNSTATEGIGLSNLKKRAIDLTADFEIRTDEMGTVIRIAFDLH